MKLDTNKKKFAAAVLSAFVIFDYILMLLVTPVTVVAAAECKLNPQHGWHIVGGGQDNDHWFDTQEECLAALNPATEEPTDVPTEEPTETVTVTPDPTQTVDPTDIPTEEPTETPVVTETPSTTPSPTEESTETPVVTLTPVPPAPSARGSLNCQKAWNMILNNVYKDVGYRFFDNPEHAYCQTWLRNRYGIDYTVYKAMNP